MNLKIVTIAHRKLKTIWKLTVTGIYGVRMGCSTWWELILTYVNYTIATFTRKDPLLHLKAKMRRVKKEYLRNGIYIFKEARLPSLDSMHEISFAFIIDDTFLVYLKHGDCYDEAKINALYEWLSEGPYCLRNELVDVTISGGGILFWTREAG
jgi:hypothetical protein